MTVRRSVGAAVVAVLSAVPVLSACSGDATAEVRGAAQAFLDDWSKGSLPAAAGRSTDQAVLTGLLEQTAADLPGAVLTARLDGITVKGDTAQVRWTATWHLAAAPDWTFPAALPLRQTGGSWRVEAQPTVVHPELRPGQHLRLTRTLPERAPVTDASGAPLFTATEVVTIGVDSGKVTDLPALAAALDAATGAGAKQIVSDVQKAAPGQFVPVISLRRPDFEAVRAKVHDLPGTVFATESRMLAPGPRYAVALLGRVGAATAEVLDAAKSPDGRPRYAAGDQLGLSGLQRAYQEQLTGTPGFAVSVVSTDPQTGDRGRQVGALAPQPGSPVRTPLVRPLQNAADAAVATQQLPTHLVVVRPGTGEILAVSSNAAADPSLALSGRFPPGSSMKTITATALLAAGKVASTTSVPCPATTVVDGREFSNANKFDLGLVPLTEAFAQSCNTTFIQQSMPLPDDAFAKAAASYGVAAEWKLPVPLFSGSVPAAATGTTKAADVIGQGQVLLSPAALALVAAGIAGGTPAPPVEVVGSPPAGRTPGGPSAQVLEGVCAMMRQVVLTGTAKALAGRGEVYGKTGTAEYGSDTPPKAHGWFMGYQRGGRQGDIAFAALVEGGTSSTAAIAVTDGFLGALG